MTFALLAGAAVAASPEGVLLTIEAADRTTARWGAVELVVPDVISHFEALLELGVRGAGPHRRVRFAGRFVPWNDDQKLRWMQGETLLSTGQTTVWVVDLDLRTNVRSRCRYGTAQTASVKSSGPVTTVRTTVTVEADCAATPPPLDCGSPLEPVADSSGPVQLPPSPGLHDPPMNGETAAQERGFIQPAVANAIRRAAREVACRPPDGAEGTGWPLVIGDRSLEDGTTPQWKGQPAHPVGSHVDGWDADLAYYQRGYAPDNDIRPVCPHELGGQKAHRCVGPPTLLDVDRTALFVGLLAADPAIRCVGVDGRIGPLLLDAQVKLVASGRLARAAPEKLCFEVRDGGSGWFHHHHDHLHVQGVRPRVTPG